jgi:hypothetical protein
MVTNRPTPPTGHATAFVDTNGNAPDGGKTYKIHLPPNIPASNFWSLMLYDSQTRSMLQTDAQFPIIGSQTKGIVNNADSSELRFSDHCCGLDLLRPYVLDPGEVPLASPSRPKYPPILESTWTE